MGFAEFLRDKLPALEGRKLDENHPLGHEIDAFAVKDPGGIKGFVESLGTWAKEHPGKILTLLHAIRPVLAIKNVTVATSFEAVKDILGRDADFAVTYGPKMDMITQGAGFFLGMDDADTRGFVARTNMQMLFRRDDVNSIVRPLIRNLAQSKLATLKQGFDLVNDYLKYLPAQFAIEYFGFSNIDKQWLYKVTAGLFDYLFIDVTNNPVIGKQAEQFASELREALDAEIALGSAPANTVLGRGLALQKASITGFDGVSLRNNMLGLLIGLVPTTVKSAAMAYDYGTRTPAEAQAFFTSFRNGNEAHFQAYVRELTRLNPINPGLFRQAVRDARVNSGGRAYDIPKGNMIFVGTYTAMRDAAALPDPTVIVPGRPDSAYLTYGFGLHACFGRYINDLHVAALLWHCFAAGHLERAAGNAGDLVFDGAFPARLTLNS
jgi:cytochrome P450